MHADSVIAKYDAHNDKWTTFQRRLLKAQKKQPLHATSSQLALNSSDSAINFSADVSNKDRLDRPAVGERVAFDTVTRLLPDSLGKLQADTVLLATLSFSEPVDAVSLTDPSRLYLRDLLLAAQSVSRSKQIYGAFLLANCYWYSRTLFYLAQGGHEGHCHKHKTAQFQKAGCYGSLMVIRSDEELCSEEIAQIGKLWDAALVESDGLVRFSALLHLFCFFFSCFGLVSLYLSFFLSSCHTPFLSLHHISDFLFDFYRFISYILSSVLIYIS